MILWCVSYVSVDRVQAVREEDYYGDEILSFIIKALLDFSLSAWLLRGCLEVSMFLPECKMLVSDSDTAEMQVHKQVIKNDYLILPDPSFSS